MAKLFTPSTPPEDLGPLPNFDFMCDEGTAGRAHLLFTAKQGGVSTGAYAGLNLGDHVGDRPAAVEENRRRLCEVAALDTVIWMDQTHSTHVRIVDEHTQVPVVDTDSVVTHTPGVALAVVVADCVPVLLVDAAAGVIAAAHAGRKGAGDGIIPRTLSAMYDLGARPDTMTVYLGPAASGSNYEVPSKMAADMETRLPGSRTTTAKGTLGVDIRAGLSRQLLTEGVHTVHVSPICTIADERYYSYRREGVTGRQAGVVWFEAR